MASNTPNSTTVSVTSQAPAPSVSIASHDFTDLIYINLGKKEKYGGNFRTLLADVLLGCGTVDLHSVAIKVLCTADGQTVKAGFSPEGSSFPIDVIALKANGFYHVSTVYNYGTAVTVSMVPEDTLSTQIQPIPADRPGMKFSIEKSADANVVIEVKIRVLGMRTRILSLN